jgi:hypothetical protein
MEAGDGEELSMDPEDVAARALKRHWRERPQRLIAPLTDGVTIMVVFALIGLGLRKSICLDLGQLAT